MNNNLKLPMKHPKSKLLYVIIFVIVLTLLYNYFYKISNFSDQVNNFILISIVTGLVFIYIFKKRNVPINKIYKITLYTFLVFLIIYLLFGSRIQSKFKINSMHSIILLFGICLLMYIIYTFASANL